MAERNQKVFDRVRQEMEKNPTAGSRALYEAAQQADKSIGQDSLQQFHARYVLPLKREQRKAAGGPSTPKRAARGRRKGQRTGETAPAPVARRGRRSRADAGTERDRVRGLLLQFAQELADAESRSSLVQVLGRVDQYVTRIVPDGK